MGRATEHVQWGTHVDGRVKENWTQDSDVLKVSVKANTEHHHDPDVLYDETYRAYYYY